MLWKQLNVFFCQKRIREQINACNTILPKTEKCKFGNLNPEASILKVLDKLHKENKPIRLIINWCNFPAYKITKYITQVLKQVLKLPNIFNLNNSLHLTNEIDNLNFDHNTRFICNKYTNIPKQDPLSIIKDILEMNKTPTQIHKK